MAIGIAIILYAKIPLRNPVQRKKRKKRRGKKK